MWSSSSPVVKSERIFYICRINRWDMKDDIRQYDNQKLEREIQRKMQELIELRNEQARRAGEKHPMVDYDFTQRVTH